GRRAGSGGTWSGGRGCTSAPGGCARSWPSAAGCAGGPSTRSSTSKTPLPWPLPGRNWRRRGEKVRAAPGRYELHFQDETHLETNPHLARTWHRKGWQPTLPGGGTNRRVTVCGSVEALGRGRIGLGPAAQDAATFGRYL